MPTSALPRRKGRRAFLKSRIPPRFALQRGRAIAAFPPLVVVTGGQTGVDRAALDAAIAAALPIAGFCPAGRGAEDGPIARHYPLVEAALARPSYRTLLNMDAADGTLILAARPLSGGTALMMTHACGPKALIDPAAQGAARAIRFFIGRNKIRWLNIGGPRASKAPAIHLEAFCCLVAAFKGRRRGVARLAPR